MNPESMALSPAQVAEALGISQVTVRRLIRDHELQSFTIGRSRRVPAAELREFMARRLSVPA